MRDQYLEALPEWTATEWDAAGLTLLNSDGRNLWSGVGAPPAIGTRVRVPSNGLGEGVVVAYFIAGKFLGVRVRFDAPPAWYVAKTSADYPGHCFGAEIEVLEAVAS